MIILAQVMISLPKYLPICVSIDQEINLQQYANKIWSKQHTKLVPKFESYQQKIIYITQLRRLLSIWSNMSHLYNTL